MGGATTLGAQIGVHPTLIRSSANNSNFAALLIAVMGKGQEKGVKLPLVVQANLCSLVCARVHDASSSKIPRIHGPVVCSDDTEIRNCLCPGTVVELCGRVCEWCKGGGSGDYGTRSSVL